MFYIEPWLLSFDTAMNAISFTSITLLQIVTFNTAYNTTFIHTIYITNPCLLHPQKRPEFCGYKFQNPILEIQKPILEISLNRDVR